MQRVAGRQHQGAGAHPERLVTLHGADVGLRFDDDAPADLDVEALRAALEQPRTEQWSGVLFGRMEPFDGLMLWLASQLDGFGMLSRSRTDAARAVVDPASPVATPTLATATGFAYLTFRETDRADTYEFGAYAHGPDAAALAAHPVEQIRAWGHRPPRRAGRADRGLPGRHPARGPPPGPGITKKHSTVVITWP